MKKQLQYLKGKNVWEIQVLCLDEEKETIFYNCCVFMAKKCITEILYSAIAEELISPFPFDEITEYAMNSKKYVFWKQNNIECFFKLAQTGNCYLEYLLVFFLGLKTGELLGLKFSNINFKNAFAVSGLSVVLETAYI